MRSQGWLPASVIALRQYSSRAFIADLIAGVTVGLVALPLAMAFAISSGMTPQAGLYCAVVTPSPSRWPGFRSRRSAAASAVFPRGCRHSECRSSVRT